MIHAGSNVRATQPALLDAVLGPAWLAAVLVSPMRERMSSRACIKRRRTLFLGLRLNVEMPRTRSVPEVKVPAKVMARAFAEGTA